MYIAKVLVNKTMKRIALYHSYESALSDVTTGSCELFDGLNIDGIDFSRPYIVAGGTNMLGFDGDFEFRYNNGLTVYIGEPIFRDERMEENIC